MVFMEGVVEQRTTARREWIPISREKGRFCRAQIYGIGNPQTHTNQTRRRGTMNIGTSWKKGATLGAALFGLFVWNLPAADAQIPGGTLDPISVPKFQTPLLIPPVMPKAGKIIQKGGKNVDYYEISVRQFSQQILPAGLPRRRCGVTAPSRRQARPGCCSTTPRPSPSRQIGTSRCG